MSEENVNEVEVEIEVESNEVPEVEIETKEPEAQEPTPKKKPWETEDKENDTSNQKIPYSRFKEVVEEKKLYRERLEQYEKELEELKSRVEPKKKEIESPDELDPNDFETVKDYLAARDKVQAEVIERNFLKRMETQKQEQEVKEREEKIATDFNDRVSNAAKINPDVIPAVQYIERFAQHIPAQVRYALLTDENAGELCHEIATNEDFLKLVVQGNPVEAIRKMASWSAKFTREEPKETNTKSVDEKLEDIKAMVPKTVKGSVASNKKDPSKMSMSEYKKWRGM